MFVVDFALNCRVALIFGCTDVLATHERLREKLLYLLLQTQSMNLTNGGATRELVHGANLT